MKERPILFNGEMVRAILDGRKTQTRRPVKPQPEPIPEDVWKDKRVPSERQFWWPSKKADQMVELRDMASLAPLGTVGDRLWVMETWAAVDWCDKSAPRDFGSAVWYQVDDSGPHAAGAIPYKTDKRGKWRQSIHMPRWASRIDLEITRVWVERVQDITEEDAKAEGVIPDDYEGYEHPDNPTLSCAAHRYSFRDLWQSIYGTWDANPWVWAYEFRRVKP